MSRRARWTLFFVLLAVSLGLSLLAWLVLGSRNGLYFLLLPLAFPPFTIGGRHGGAPPVRHCSTCGLKSDDAAVAFCPRDGTPLMPRPPGPA